MQILTNLIFEVLKQLHSITGSLGWSIVIFTIISKSLLLPLSLPMLKSQQKIKEIQPEIDKLKKKHGKDKKALQVAQLELYKRYNINPLAGCLPQIIQIILIIVLYQALSSFVGHPEKYGVMLNLSFGWLNLGVPDRLRILPILAVITQLILSLMIMPGGQVLDLIPNNSKDSPTRKANQSEEDMANMAATMQKQTLFILPAMTGFFALSFPSGITLYWVVSTVFAIFQQYFISGLGGLIDLKVMFGNLVQKLKKN